MKKHEFAIFIGRFSPFHLGHKVLLDKALEVAEKVVVVLGSHNRAKNIKNPWSSEERKHMIELALTSDEKSRVNFVFMNDYLYNDNQWLATLQGKIAEATNDAEDIALVGFNSDDSSYYLKLFPKWQYYNCPTQYNFHATKIRDFIFHKDCAFKECVHPEVAKYLNDWSKTDEFKRLKEEFDFVSDYKEKWRGAPFSPIFNTTDCLVLKSGHVLVVRRKGKYGKGLLALPGGFLNADERIQEGAIRELKEETAIKLSKEELAKAIVDQKVFDHPNRSIRGRTITFAFMLNLGSGELPKVKGSDDAEKAIWLPLNEVVQREAEFFEDHFYVIQHFVNKF
jgi:bifunctional NMN adenylyltransferase/nudix hydrolase